MWAEDPVDVLDCTSASSDTDEDNAPVGPRIVDDPEVWMDYYSEELLDAWYALKRRCETLGAVLDTCTFPDFAQFCFQFSSGRQW